MNKVEKLHLDMLYTSMVQSQLHLIATFGGIKDKLNREEINKITEVADDISDGIEKLKERMDNL